MQALGLLQQSVMLGHPCFHKVGAAADRRARGAACCRAAALRRRGARFQTTRCRPRPPPQVSQQLQQVATPTSSADEADVVKQHVNIIKSPL